MDNTKFTKGNWNVLSNAKHSDVFKIKSDLGSPTFGENEANALLISKAPEMLEMLIRCAKALEDLHQPFIAYDIKQLIKQATEL